MTTNVFETLSKVDVSEFTEKKGKFTYLSWADAVNVLLKHYPEAVWHVITGENGFPYVETPAGCFVTVELTINGIPRTQVHPVLDNYNKAITTPNAFQINTSIQRCLAKAISLHGLGLYIYRGEDLPETPQQVNPEKPNMKHVNGVYEMYLEVLHADTDEPDYQRMIDGDARLTNDERILVMDKLKELGKFPETNKSYTTIVNDCLKWHPSEEEK